LTRFTLSHLGLHAMIASRSNGCALYMGQYCLFDQNKLLRFLLQMFMKKIQLKSASSAQLLDPDHAN
jgi:hypothetical protein